MVVDAAVVQETAKEPVAVVVAKTRVSNKLASRRRGSISGGFLVVAPQSRKRGAGTEHKCVVRGVGGVFREERGKRGESLRIELVQYTRERVRLEREQPYDATTMNDQKYNLNAE